MALVDPDFEKEASQDIQELPTELVARVES
jgi:hypothetical protein